ncbi:EF-P beta-lysylation protein EpmB [Thioalkalicoccus limnaeus]|uniref:L-lysine 2,3-aminomutase n=1 Tax=Thioalkalicoccus limnaeus TaxID=120681 RepID=A0ABV4BBU7_9GAMM
MLARSGPVCQIPTWRRDLAESFTRPADLLDYLGFEPGLRPSVSTTESGFPLLVPKPFADLMQPGHPDDPLLRQVLPLADEGHRIDGFVRDPVGDRAARRAPGLLMKYRGRALLMVTGACAIHCRYCFRRHYRGQEAAATGKQVSAAVEMVARDRTIDEVILSGGDPLLRDNAFLAELFTDLASIQHLRRLRVHTRLPVVLPTRVDSELERILTGLPIRCSIVLQVNHPNELGPAARSALVALRRTGTVLLNQSVLLRGVNDEAACLARLQEALFDLGVLPYYLHQLDRVQGAAHFAVADAHAKTLVDALRLRLPGYLVPRLVRELPGHPSKVPIG